MTVFPESSGKWCAVSLRCRYMWRSLWLFSPWWKNWLPTFVLSSWQLLTCAAWATKNGAMTITRGGYSYPESKNYKNSEKGKQHVVFIRSLQRSKRKNSGGRIHRRNVLWSVISVMTTFSSWFSSCLRPYSEWENDHDHMVAINWSGISCQIFSVFMNKLWHENSTNQKEDTMEGTAKYELENECGQNWVLW